MNKVSFWMKIKKLRVDFKNKFTLFFLFQEKNIISKNIKITLIFLCVFDKIKI